MINKHIGLIVLFIVLAADVSGNNEKINFRRVTPPGGLSFQHINDIEQDKQGNIWLGTYDGVFRYNSKSFKHFFHHRLDSTSLINNETTTLLIDRNNTLWVGTHEGVCVFDIEKQSFDRIDYWREDENQVTQIIQDIKQDKKGNIWIVEQECVGILDQSTHLLRTLKLQNGDKATCIFFNKEDVGFIGTNSGSVYKIDRDNFAAIKIIKQSGQIVSTLYAQSNTIWVGYKRSGIQRFNIDGELLRSYWETGKLDEQQVRDIICDDKQNIWVGTYNGLFMIKEENLYHFNQKTHAELSHNSIFTLFKDNSGAIWIGTWSGGLNYLNYNDNVFKNYRKNNSLSSISNNIVSSFTQMADGTMYIGTEVGGLNKFNTNTKLFHSIELKGHNDVDYNIKTLYTDCYDGLWVGTYNDGLFYRPRNSKKFIQFDHGNEDGRHVSNKSIYSIVGDTSGVWIGTDGGAVNYYSYKSKEISFFNSLFPNITLPCRYVRSLLLDNAKRLWIGTHSGLFRIQDGCLNTFETEGDKAISDSHILHLNQLHDGRVWVSTKAGGVSIINPQNDNVTVFDTNGLLKEKSVYGVIEDANNKLWLTTKAGLIHYDTKKKTIQQFSLSDGVQGNVFNPQALYLASNNNIYIGGTNGFSQFNASKINSNKRAPNVIIDNVMINNKRRLYISQGPINILSTVKLKADETDITFDFAADNYLLPEKNRFKYRLLNFNDEWIDAGKEGIAVYTNLPDGDYIFEVKASNNDGIWSNSPTVLNVLIATPWWRSGIALMLYFILLLAIVAVVVKTIKERQKLKNEVFIEKFERQNEEHIHEMKLKFFTNISHEFRTPLTLINGPVKKLIKSDNLDPEQKNTLGVVLRNSNRLLKLINQVLDLRTFEKDFNQLNVERFDVYEFIAERSMFFAEEAKNKNIKFDINIPKDKQEIEADPDMLDNIVFNLLSNAFKYTPENRKVSIAIAQQGFDYSNKFANQLKFGHLSNEDFFELTIEDTGNGVDSEDMLKIFNRFERGKTVGKNSTGIGLSMCKEYVLLHHGEIIAQSNPGKGTRFTIKMPLKQVSQNLIFGVKKNGDKKEVEKVMDLKDLKTSTKSDFVYEVLVVEDNPDLRQYICNLLSPFYNVLEAADGVEAIEILELKHCDIVVSDIMMANMDGLELCKAIKSQVALNHIPVILLTALASIKNKMSGLEVGADAYVSKPFEDELLLIQIKNLLEQRTNLRESFKSRLIDANENDSSLDENHFIKKINHVIDSNYTEESFCVEDLSKKIGLHRSQLHRKLKHLTSYSATEYIRIYRLKKGAELLRGRQHSVDQVAFLVGFGSRSYFSKCFKSFFNVSPKEFQRANNQG
jgi:signal transduction histidine kinase/DNA-binding response OmpR family regulator/streptogramin lyase